MRSDRRRSEGIKTMRELASCSRNDTVNPSTWSLSSCRSRSTICKKSSYKRSRRYGDWCEDGLKGIASRSGFVVGRTESPWPHSVLCPGPETEDGWSELLQKLNEDVPGSVWWDPREGEAGCQRTWYQCPCIPRSCIEVHTEFEAPSHWGRAPEPRVLLQGQ